MCVSNPQLKSSSPSGFLILLASCGRVASHHTIQGCFLWVSFLSAVPTVASAMNDAECEGARDNGRLGMSTV